MHGESIILERTWPPPADPYASPNRIGGRPNLPPEIAWPRIRFADGQRASLDFLAQIDLWWLPQVRERDLLPATGMLFFFALSQIHTPLEESGVDAFRVIYVPNDTRNVALREIPSDAGWNLDEMEHTRTIAAQARQTDGPRGELHPACAVRPKTTVETRERDPLFFSHLEQPVRVEDALLVINAARNTWFENIVPLNEFIEIRKAAARSSLAFSAKRYPGKTIAPAPWIETVLSDEAVRTFEQRYAEWREKATNMWHELAARGRTAALAPHDRADVLSLVAEASTLHRTVHWNDIRPAKMVAVSLPTLLAHDPAFAAEIPAEMNALAPVQSHYMLGSGKRVQNGTMTGPDPVLLLQLDSDEWGPRFDCWDAGNITFWISAADLHAGRFDLARAEIEGH
jgi:hypothetical protein